MMNESGDAASSKIAVAGAAAALCCLGALASLVALPADPVPLTGHTAVVAGGPSNEDPVGWCRLTRACQQ